MNMPYCNNEHRKYLSVLGAAGALAGVLIGGFAAVRRHHKKIEQQIVIDIYLDESTAAEEDRLAATRAAARCKTVELQEVGLDLSDKDSP